MTNPEFSDNVRAGTYVHTALLHGVVYQLNDGFLNPSTLHDHDVPCAVCEVPRSTSMMVPAKRTCPQGWTLEYEGLLMAGHWEHPGQSEYICVSLGMESVPGGSVDTGGGLLYVVEVDCGFALPCPPYVEGYELSCVVCSK